MPPIQVYIFKLHILTITFIHSIVCFRSSDNDIDLVPLDTFCQESSMSAEDIVCKY